MTPLAVIGAGAIAQAHAEAIRSLPDVELVAVVDPNLDAARRLAGPHEARVFATTKEMLAANVARATIVSAPPAVHEEIALLTVRAGVATLCEKPFAPTAVAARRMARAAREAGTLLALASKFRFAEGVVAARKVLDSGELGAVELVENVFTSALDMAGRWQADPAVSGGGVVMDNAPHGLDLIRFLFGPVAAVRAAELAPPRLAVEESAHLSVLTESGVFCTVLLSWRADVRRPWFLAAHGSRGTLEVGWRETRVRRGNDWEVVAGGYDKAKCFRALLADFLGAARGDHPPAVSPDDAVANVACVESAYESLAQNSWPKSSESPRA